MFNMRKFTGIVMPSPATENKHRPGRLTLFNQLNKLAVAATLIRAIFIFLAGPTRFLQGTFLINLLPAFLFAVIILLNKQGRLKAAMLLSFYAIHLLLLGVGLLNHDYSLGYFILILSLVSFFFLEKQAAIIASFATSTICFLILRWQELATSGNFISAYSQWVAIADLLLMVVLGFFVLSFIRNEINNYQQKLVAKNQRLHGMNREIVAQKDEISRQAGRVEEQQAILADSDKLKTQLLSVISHDLRLPLVSVKNMFDVYEKNLMTQEEFIEYVPQLNHEINRALELLENMLQWSKQQMGETVLCKEEFSLGSLAQTAVAFYQLSSTSKNITINNCIQSDCMVKADRQLVKMVLRNLLSNAIKFTPDGGLVHITAEEENGVTHIHVTDNGVGMTPEQVQRVLDKGAATTAGTRHEAGAGLGLKLCQEFIKRNGGTFGIKSKPGYGSTLSFTLPALIPEHKPQVRQQHEAAPVIHINEGHKYSNQARQRVSVIASGISNFNNVTGWQPG
jgi:two-component system, sensor histidine kinase and response regulator